MELQALAYFVLGLSMVITLVVIIFFYYSNKRHRSVEEPKYKMLKDDD